MSFVIWNVSNNLSLYIPFCILNSETEKKNYVSENFGCERAERQVSQRWGRS